MRMQILEVNLKNGLPTIFDVNCLGNCDYANLFSLPPVQNVRVKVMLVEKTPREAIS